MPPPTPLDAITAIPTAIRIPAGIRPIRKTAPPIATLPVICSPQRCLKRPADRFRVSIGPVPSSAITGTARKVISDQPSCRRRPKIMPAIPPCSCSRPTIVPITVETSAQPAIWPKRLPGDGGAVGELRVLAAEDHVRAGGEADAVEGADQGQQVEADDHQRCAQRQPAVVDQVEARSDDDDRHHGRGHPAVEREADQLAMLGEQPPTLPSSGPSLASCVPLEIPYRPWTAERKRRG